MVNASLISRLSHAVDLIRAVRLPLKRTTPLQPNMLAVRHWLTHWATNPQHPSMAGDVPQFLLLSAETWAGRGKQPRWLVAQLRSGKRIEDFTIQFRNKRPPISGRRAASSRPQA